MQKRPRQAGQAQRRLAEARRQRRRRQLQIGALFGALAVVAVALVAVVVVVLVNRNSSATTQNAHGMAQGAPVDGIRCQTSEQVAYHIHAHLAIFDNGSPQVVPLGIGIPRPRQVQQGFVTSGKCFYWLHTHDTSGVIHIESPTRTVYTLGQFFDIWGQPLSSSQVGKVTGKVTVYVDGKQFTGNPRSITLTPHKVIQLDVGQVVPPKPFTFPEGL